jgi:signal peptidase I
MTGDLSALILLVAAVAGAILLFDWLVLRRRRAAAPVPATMPAPTAAQAQGASPATPAPAVPQESIIVSYARSLFPVLLIVLVFRSFMFEPFKIPSASMMPGLQDGDFILVNKFSYGLRLPVINTKVLSIGEPERGDVVVFRSPGEPGKNLIKRLVGLPGDHVRVMDNRLFINGTEVRQAPDGLFQGGFGFAGSPLEREQFGDAEHVIMLAPQRYAADFAGVVPAGHYFFMGDNRNDSEDSRFPIVGFVPENLIVGHAIRIWMNWRIPQWPEWGRIGTRIR